MRVISFPDNLTIWQKELLEGVGNNYREQEDPILVIAPRQCYKSSTIALLLIKSSLELVGDSVYISLTLGQSRSQLADTVKFLDGSRTIKRVNYQTLELTFVNGSRIYFRSAEQKDSLRGLTAENILVFDEACWMNEDFILTALPLRRVKRALTIYISSPFIAEGFIWNLYNDSSTRLYDWSKYINLIYTKEELAKLKEQYTPMRYLTEILGRWAPPNNGLLFNNIKDSIREREFPNNQIFIGIDCSSAIDGDNTVVSAFNQDREQIALFANNTLRPVDRVKWIADKIKEISKLGSINKIIVEKNSMGDTYIDLLKKEISFPITGWTTSASSKRDYIENMQKLLEQKRVKFLNDPLFIKELQCFEAKIKDNKITYSGKNCTDDRVLASSFALYAIEKNLGKYNLS